MPQEINQNLRFGAGPKETSAAELFAQIQGRHHRRALGKAITLLESTRPEDRAVADELMDLALAANRGKSSFRLGVSGTPGVGKSTFVENFGLEVIKAGHRLAVLAIDPSSSLSGGSILGDKTRMEELSRHPEAYIRPSPNAGHLGGVGAASRAAVLLCEAAGYDYIMVETVGVGQAEWQVHGMTDAFLLLSQPAAGDDLQSIKRGILELADLILVNKADRMPKAAKETARQLRQGLHLAPPRPDDWIVKVSTISALNGDGLAKARAQLQKYYQHAQLTGTLATRRQQQLLQWLRERCQQSVNLKLDQFLKQRSETSDGLQRIIDEQITLSSATDVLIAEFFQQKKY